MSDKSTDTEKTAEATAAEVGQPAAPVVNWDDSQMRTTYANVVNAASTREEVTLFFDVKLEERVVLNPHAAKRLFVLMGAVLAQYEKRFGEIKLEGLQAAAAAAKANGKEN